MKKVIFFIAALFITLKVAAQASSIAIDPSLTESPISVKTFSGSISGSLVMPNNPSGKIPVVLIIADAGPTDRDGNNARDGVNDNTYKMLANGLGKSG